MSDGYLVYKLTCSATKRFYIGVIDDLVRRFKQHTRCPPRRTRKDAAAHTPFATFFQLTVLRQTISLAAAQTLERDYIRDLQARGRMGYNTLTGHPGFDKQF